jgi:hypothetical protein
MLDFQGFIKSFPTNGVVRDNPAAQYLYEKIIWRDDVRIKFADVSNVRIPALSVCVKEIEDYCVSQNSLDLQSNPIKQTIGRMVAAAMEPLGYIPVKRTRMPLNANSQFFTSAHIYEYVGNETQRIERHIVNVADIEGGVENEKTQ